MTYQDKHLQQTRTTINEFIDYVRPLFVEIDSERDYALLRAFFLSMSDETLLSTVIENISPFIQQIESQDEKYFFQNEESIFSTIEKDKRDILRDRWLNGKVSETRKKTIWKFMTLLGKICSKYS